MKQTSLTSLRVLLAGAAVCGFAFGAQAGNPNDIEQYIAVKGIHYFQSGEGAPVLVTNEPYRFQANVDQTDPGRVKSATLRKPNNTVLTLTTNDGDSSFSFEPRYATQAALDAAFPPGNYLYTIGTANNGTQSVALTVTTNAYPAAAPRIANWSALQSVNTNNPTLIQWDGWTDGTTNDLIIVNVEDDMGNGWSSPEPGQPGGLDGTSTSTIIPAGQFVAGRTYRATVLFARPTTLDTTSIPGALGITAFFRETFFNVVAVGSPPPAGRFFFSSAAFSGGEGGGSLTVTIQRDGTAGSASVVLTTHAGTASPGVDYGETTERVNFGDTIETLDVSIPIADDFLLEGNETILLSLSDPAGGAELGFPTNAIGTITDDEIRGRGTLQFSTPASMVAEGAGFVNLTVTRSGGATGEVSVIYAAESGSATNAGTHPDFTPTGGTLTFSNGVTALPITVPILADTLDESNETFTVTLFFTTGGAALGANSVATVTIKDDDTAGIISFSKAKYSTIEANTNLAVIIRRTGGAASAVTVDLDITGGTATRGDDYTHSGGSSVTLTFDAGVTAITNDFAILDDRDPEGDENILLNLRNATGGARVAGITNSTITILDDEVTLQFSADTYTNKEPAGAAIVFLDRTGPINVPASVTVGTTSSGSSAAAFEDYIPTNFVVTFAAGQRRKPVAIRLVNDFLVEDAESVKLVLEDPSANALLGPRDQATLYITSEDAAGKIGFSVASVNVPESRAFVPITVIRTLGLASNVTARLSTAAMSAADGLDYVGTNLTLSFAAREVRKVVNIPILPDALAEGPESFQVTLDNPAGGLEIDPSKSSQGVIILDNDSGGVIGFSRAEYIVTENTTNAIITITRTGGAASNVVVHFQTADGTATAFDYQAVDTTVTFADGETSKTVEVPINYVDSDPEGAVPETVLLTLRDYMGGARPGLSNAVLKIVDDESSVAFTASTAAGNEGATVTLTVARAGALTTAVSVDFMTMGDTATEGTDYTATNGTLTFAANQASKTITIRLTADPNTESNETFTVVLKNPQGGVLLGAQSNVVVTISDRPDPAAIPAAGQPFFKATIVGIQGNAISKTINITTNVPNVIATSYDQNLGWLGINGFNNKLTVGSSSVRTVNNWMQFVNIHASGPGVIDLAFSAGNGGVVWSFSDTTSFFTPGREPIIHEVRAYGTGIQGSSGTLTIDVLDVVHQIVTGRFDFIAVDDTNDNKFVRITGSFRSHNTVVSGN